MCNLEIDVSQYGEETPGNGDQKHKKQNILHLRWSRLLKTVQTAEEEGGLLRGSIAGPKRDSSFSIGKQKGSQTKTILSNVSGSAPPGQVICLMGPSGSGKTTLLNCLSGRTSYDSGTISVNGRPLNSMQKKRLMTKIAYVKQADIFFTHLTVRDQLSYTALLRLPQKWTKASKMAEVDRIIQMLRLQKVADLEIRLLSGGEKKRTNIGTELLTDPSCLLLDEPTSGLDSTSAVDLIKMLQSLARSQHKSVITSIHQPSSAVFFSFDQLLLLAEGKQVYLGAPKDSLEYLRSRNMACPDGYNAADHWMDLLVLHDSLNTTINATHIETGSASSRSNNFDNQQSVTLLIEGWDNEAVAEQIELACKEQEESNAVGEQSDLDSNKSFSKYSATWGFQYRILVHRALKNSRSAIFTPINMMKSAALGVVVGLLYFQMPYTEAAVFDRNSYFFFAMTYWVFDAMFNALMAFPQERHVILKERSSGAYHLSAYFMAKTTSEMPMRMALPSLYMSISFWMAGISPRVSLFLMTTFISLLSVIAGESIGLLIGATIDDMEKAMATMTVASLTLMLLGGFFLENVPAWLVWGKFLSPFKYSFDASRQLVFDRDVPCDGSGALESYCENSSSGTVSPEEVFEFLSVQGSVGFNTGMLFVIGIVPRFIAYCALRTKKEDDRS